MLQFIKVKLRDKKAVSNIEKYRLKSSRKFQGRSARRSLSTRFLTVPRATLSIQMTSSWDHVIRHAQTIVDSEVVIVPAHDFEHP
jgi:hypothetical protein